MEEEDLEADGGLPDLLSLNLFFLFFGGVVVVVGVVAGTGFLPESFPVTGVNGVGKVPHSLEC